MKTNQIIPLLIVALFTSIVTLATYKLTGLDRNLVIFEEAKSSKKDENLVKLAKKGDLKDKKLSDVPDFADIAEKATPMVVHIVATQTSKNTTRRGGELPDMFREFFGDDFGGREFRGPQKSQGSGSGVIISNDGYIVTNNHVIEDATEVEVILSDKRTYKAQVIGTAPSTDLAVIKINEKNLPNIVLGNSDNVRVGEWVLAVGNPFNLESTITAGIVSAKGRSLNILRDKDQAPIEAFIQTDAAVNPGNSGGALINTKGELIGINTAIATPTGTYAGYSFAVPVNIVKKVMKDLIEYGTVQRGYLGVVIRQVDGRFAQEKGLKDISEGVYVESVNENSAGAIAGIKSGDVIIGLDGKNIKSSPELLEEIGKRRPGDKVALEVIRNGKTQIINVYLKNKEGNTEITTKKTNDVLSVLGAEISEVSATEKRELGIEGGVKVNKINGGKIGKETDMKEGFIITRMGGQPIKSLEDFTKKLQNTKGGVFLSGVYPDVEGEFYYAFGM